MLAVDLTPEIVTEQPPHDGWWRVDWPDGRWTAYRSEGSALELAQRIRTLRGKEATVSRRDDL